MKNSSFSGLGGTRTGLAVFGALTVLILYILWVGVTGHPVPRWILWLATVF